MDGPTVDTERQGGLEEKLALTSRHSLGLRNVKNKKAGTGSGIGSSLRMGGPTDGGRPAGSPISPC